MLKRDVAKHLVDRVLEKNCSTTEEYGFVGVFSYFDVGLRGGRYYFARSNKSRWAMGNEVSSGDTRLADMKCRGEDA